MIDTSVPPRNWMIDGHKVVLVNLWCETTQQAWVETHLMAAPIVAAELNRFARMIEYPRRSLIAMQRKGGHAYHTACESNVIAGALRQRAHELQAEAEIVPVDETQDDARSDVEPGYYWYVPDSPQVEAMPMHSSIGETMTSWYRTGARLTFPHAQQVEPKPAPIDCDHDLSLRRKSEPSHAWCIPCGAFRIQRDDGTWTEWVPRKAKTP